VLSAEPVAVDDREGLRVEIAAGADHGTLEFNFRQAHNVMNALAAIGAAHALGLPLSSLAQGARSVRFSALRGERLELPGGVIVINDSYNANPMSMRAALDDLTQVASERGGARAVAVLGEMAELGPEADRFHREIGAHAAARGVDVLLAVGPLGESYADGFAGAGAVERPAGPQEAAEAVRDIVKPGDVVLVKASRSVGLETVAERLAGQVA
jgi:UDP-N-acetylmuramoyl-tripeptide--D-alanyl-D-alanine ligase